MILHIRPFLPTDSDSSRQSAFFSSVTDIGSLVNGQVLTAATYATVEDCVSQGICNALFLSDLRSNVWIADEERFTGAIQRNRAIESEYSIGKVSFVKMPRTATPITKTMCRDLVRMVLRECCWCRFKSDHGAFAHFGYDFNQYVGSSNLSEVALENMFCCGLKVGRVCVSPYDG